VIGQPGFSCKDAVGGIYFLCSQVCRIRCKDWEILGLGNFEIDAASKKKERLASKKIFQFPPAIGGTLFPIPLVMISGKYFSIKLEV